MSLSAADSNKPIAGDNQQYSAPKDFYVQRCSKVVQKILRLPPEGEAIDPEAFDDKGVYTQQGDTVTELELSRNYAGKTLTVAQSTLEWAETETVRAYPAKVLLYCGYAYESTLITESFTVFASATALFLLGVVLLVAFIRSFAAQPLTETGEMTGRGDCGDGVERLFVFGRS